MGKLRRMPGKARLLQATFLLILAALLLPVAVVAEPSRTEPAAPLAEETPNRFMVELRQGMAAARAGDWETAIAHGRISLDEARGNDNHFEEYDAAQFLISVLMREKRYDEARRVAQVQAARFAPLAGSDRDGERLMLAQALRIAALAKDERNVRDLQQRIVRAGQAYGQSWRYDAEQRRLRDAASGLALPTRAGDWIMSRFAEGAGHRTPRIIYQRIVATDDGSLGEEMGELDITLSWTDEAADMPPDAQQWQGQLEDLLGTFRDNGDVQPLDDASLASLLPGSAPVQGMAVIRGDGEKEGREAWWWRWRDGRRLAVGVRASADDWQRTLLSLRPLFEAIRWEQGELTAAERRAMLAAHQRMDELVRQAYDWDAAAELVQNTPPTPHDADDALRRHAIQGMQAYQRGDWAAAYEHLAAAEAAWPHSSRNHADNFYQEEAQPRLIDASYRSGDTASARRLHHAELSGGLNFLATGWTLDERNAMFVHSRNEWHLPWRLGDFLLLRQSETLYYYRNIATGEQVGMTLALPAALSRDQLLASFLDSIRNQFRMKVLDQSEPEEAAAVPTWRFTIAEDAASPASQAGDEPEEMLFRLIEGEGARVVLRIHRQAGGDESNRELDQVFSRLSRLMESGLNSLCGIRVNRS